VPGVADTNIPLGNADGRPKRPRGWMQAVVCRGQLTCSYVSYLRASSAMSARSPSAMVQPLVFYAVTNRRSFEVGSWIRGHVPSKQEVMPKSRGALKKYKTKVVRQKKKRVSGKLRTTLLPTAAELWKEKGTVRSNYAELGLSAGADQAESLLGQATRCSC
jgi:hypothetical protein